MEEKYIKLIAEKLNLKEFQVKNTIDLFNQGATIPFISRYRKEATGSLDEVQIGEIKKELNRLEELDKRRESILQSIEKQDKLTPALKLQIENALTIVELEDLYLPYKQKRKTRASVAKENGLEPLAQIIFKQTERDVEGKAQTFLNDKITNTDEALQGARDIIAEQINEDVKTRNKIRYLFQKDAVIKSKLVKGKEAEGVKYQDYFEYSELLKNCPSHRLLALMRGEHEGFLKVSIFPDEERAIEQLKVIHLKGNTESSAQVEMALADSYKRLLQPSIETEFNNIAKEKADTEAIAVFSSNLRTLLMASPLGAKRVLAIDPGFRTGCKVVCLDAQGNLLHNENIYPHTDTKETINAAKKVNSLVNQYKIEVIAIGNGTASRETERFIKKVHFEKDVQVYIVSESGASIYSASPVAREEFPDYDVTVRGAVSIGRRLLDPLAELVKIDPKSIGVGQYQHDVDQGKLKESLDSIVESCVNIVGVEVNTASKQLLTYVSGLGPQLAQNIIDFRKEIGGFTSRSQLKKVPRMGEKAFEQSAGFLRIRNASNPLDNSAVHPESYAIVEQMAKDANCTVQELISNADLRKNIDLKKYVNQKVGLPTLNDIFKELEKPGRDPRGVFKVLEFDQNINSISDLHIGMILPGIVTNVTNFGAFVDLGIKVNGLIHVSEIADKFVSNPAEIVKVHQHVKVRVISVDTERNRIQLSMKGL